MSEGEFSDVAAHNVDVMVHIACLVINQIKVITTVVFIFTTMNRTAESLKAES